MQAVAPKASELSQPVVYFLKRSGLDRIDATGAIGTDFREAVLSQYLQVLRDRSLCDTEFFLNCFDDGSGGVFACCEQFEYTPPYRVTENVKGVHCGLPP